MARLRCESCGEAVAVERRSASLMCPACSAWIDALPWRELWATEDLEARVRADTDLPAALRQHVAGLLAERTASMRATLGAPVDQPEVEAPADAEAVPVPRREVPVLETPVQPSAPTRQAPARVGRPKDRDRERRRTPTVWERLGPAFTENLGFGLAAFLILSGAVYFTTTAWTTMSGAQRLLVVVGGLVLLGGILFGAARLLNRAGNLPEVERTLLLVAAFLAPIAAIPAGNLFVLSTWRAVLASGVVLGLGFLVARRLARVLDETLLPFLPWAYALLAAPVLVGGPLGEGAPVVGALGLGLVLLGAVWLHARRVLPHLTATGWAALWPGVLFAFAIAVAAGRLAIAARSVWPTGTVFAGLGIVVAALAAALATLEPALFARRLFGTGRHAVLLVVAIALGVSGTLMALGDDVGLLLGSVLGAYGCVRAGLGLPVPWFALPGLVLSALAYLRLPAPVKAAALELRDRAADALGYTDRPMPLAWYGLTFLPYVFGCAWVGWVLSRRGEAAMARVLLAWAFVAAVGLSALALLASGDPTFSDLRPPAAVFAAQGGLLLAVGAALRQRAFATAGTIGVFAGATCALLHVEAATPVGVLGLAALGLVAVFAAVRFARAGPEAHPAVRAGLLDAATLLALALLGVATVDALALRPVAAWHGLGYLVLTALIALLAFALRRPEGIALAALALGDAGARLVAGVAPDAGGDVVFLVLAALSSAALIAPRVDALLPAALRHPYAAAPASIGSWTPAGALAVQALGFLLLFAPGTAPGWTLPLAAGLLFGSGVLALAATRQEQPWPLYASVLQLVAGGVVGGTALAGGAWFGTGGLAGAAVAIVLTALPLLLGGSRALTVRLVPPLRHLLPVLASAYAVWSFGLVVAWWVGAFPALDGALLAGSALAVAVVVRAALARHPRSHALRAASLYAGTLFAPAAGGLLVAWHAAPHAWPLALVGAAAVVMPWAGRDHRVRPPAHLHLGLALALATGAALLGEGDATWLLVAFLLVAAGGRVAAVRRPILGWCLLLVAALLGLSLAWAARIVTVDPSLQPAIWLLFAAAAYAALRVPGLGVDPTAVRIVADPILVCGVAGALVHAGRVALLEPGTDGLERPLALTVGGLRLAEGALGLAALARSVALPFPAVGRRALALFVVGIAAFSCAPLNMWIQGSDARFWRPDVEVALLGLLLALTTPLAGQPRLADATGRLGARVAWPGLLALVGAGLTLARLRDLSTPLTVLVATATFSVLLVRDRGPRLATLAAGGVLATALCFASWWQPMPASVGEGILLLHGAVAALVAPPLAFASRWLQRCDEGSWRARAGREIYVIAVLAALLTFALVVGDLLANRGVPASTLQVILAVVALALPGLAAAWGAARAGRPRLAHVALLAALLLYTFLVQRTGLLAVLDGYHLHVLVVFGATLLFLADFVGGRLGRLLALDGVLLAAPAALRHAPAAVGLAPAASSTASALALAAVAAAAGARRLAWPFLHGVAAVLVNLMLFAFWRQNGVVDAAFYGVPPGLTLLGSAALLRGRLPGRARLALVIPGLALLYGSVGIQVVRADDPLHALVLFGLGFATVVLGFLLRRNAWIVLGVVVIVLDVVTYLLVHGFETGFFGAALLVVAGLVVMAVAALTTLRRRREGVAASPRPTPPAHPGADGESGDA